MNEIEKKIEEARQQGEKASWKIIAANIVEMEAAEYDSLEHEASDVQFTEEFDRKMRAMIADFKMRDRKKARQKRLRSLGKIAAIIFLCLTVTSGVLTVTVDAFRFKLFEILQIEHEGYTELVPSKIEEMDQKERGQLPEEWKGVYYPTMLPEGYALSEASEMGAIQSLTFENDQGEFLDLTIVPIHSGAKTGVNNEDVKVREVDINGSEGLAWEGESYMLIVWTNYEHQFKLFSGTVPLDEMLEIAENIQYKRIV